ncbi:sulfatase-like hydrolase/transferase [uncultured Roseibium sp.]|uniref:sulfatase-like hydrolase/transferase n=1 Tax=uncultured Roseibium sp. TaxID=1936171 RepID=UPI00262446E5|nr:sulfatase-like hydrolase/transferase [uncultured Roseibium sp.]
MNLSSQSTLANTLRSGAKFSSAVSKTHLDTFSTIHENQNVLVVMIEGMGAFKEPAHQNLLWEIFDSPEIKSRFEVTTGTGPYKGSTTSAETRELCGRWGDYYDYFEEREFDCLPAQYRRRGYETAAFHAFGGDLFHRKVWFPRIGFEKLFFKEQLEGSRHLQARRVCGLTFKGLCDLDVANVVELYLLEPSKKPKFAYWLTLNTHLPVEPNAATPRLDCGNETLFDDWTVCYITEMWMDVLYRVRDIALNPKLQDTQILLVGDHHPPVWTRQGRRLFVPGKVAWLHLKPNAFVAQENVASVTIAQ